MILCTVMRDSTSYLERFLDQVSALAMETDLRLVVAEGDSEDGTYGLLRKNLSTTEPGGRDVLLKVEHGGPYFPSIDHPMRWRQLGAVCEVALTAAVRLLEPDESLIYVESDLIWDTDTMLRLAKHTSTYPAVSPMSMQGRRNYETWGLVKDGVVSQASPPYFPGWSEDRMHQIDSQGSCVALSWTAAQVAHFSPIDCIRGIGRSVREAGLSLWLDPHLAVHHP